MVKERYQNPTIGDTVKLELFIYNSNMLAEVYDISQVNIFYLDPNARSVINPDGRTIIESIPGSSIVNPQTGEYYIETTLNPLLYLNSGKYIDQWEVTFRSGDVVALKTNNFTIYSDLWDTTPTLTQYTFAFYFSPNKIRLGSTFPLIIQVIPSTPTASDLANYYTNLIITGQLFINIGQHCNPCNTCSNCPIIEDDPVPFTENNKAAYGFNTEDLGIGLYDVWFKLIFDGQTYMSPTSQLHIYE